MAFEIKPCYIIVVLTNNKPNEARKSWAAEYKEENICPLPLSNTGQLPITNWGCCFLGNTLILRQISIHVKKLYKFGLNPEDDIIFFGFTSSVNLQTVNLNKQIEKFTGLKFVIKKSK